MLRQVICVHGSAESRALEDAIKRRKRSSAPLGAVEAGRPVRALQVLNEV